MTELPPTTGSERLPSEAATVHSALSAPHSAPQNSGLYLYCVTPADSLDLPPFRPPVRLVPCGSISALVSYTPLTEFSRDSLAAHQNDPAWLEERVLGHDSVIRAAMNRAAIIPFRFGTVFISEEALLDFLTQRQAPLIRLLVRFTARQEWGAKLFFRPGDFRPSPNTTVPEAAPGRAYLLHKSQQHLAREKAESEVAARAVELHRSLSSHAVSSLLHDHRAYSPNDPALLLVCSASYLTDTDSLPRFLEAADRFAAAVAPAFRVTISGPWPPYSFVSLEDGEDV